MSASRSKQKGASFERLICTQLSRWLSNGQRSDLLWRSAMSGGRSTVAFKQGDKRVAQAGDISAVDKAGHDFISLFYVECKHYKNLNLDSLIKQTGNLVNFWKLAKKEAAIYGKMPMLIAKQNHYPTMVILDTKGKQFFKLSLKSFASVVPKLDAYIIAFDDFIKVHNCWSDQQ